MNCVDIALKRIKETLEGQGVPAEIQHEQLTDIRRKLEREWRVRIIHERMAKDRISFKSACIREGINPRTGYRDAKVCAKKR